MDAIRGPSPTYKRDAIDAVLARREETAPLLLELLAQVARDPVRAAERIGDGFDLIYTLHLLTELGEERAHDDLVRVARAPRAVVESLLGEDAVTESLPAMLLATAGSRTDGLRAIATDRSLDAFVRGASASALAVAVHRGHADRDEVLGLLAGELTEEGERYASEQLICAMLQLQPVEHVELLRAKVAEHELERSVDVDARLAEGPQDEDRVPHGHDRDIHQWMSWWDCFDGRPPAPARELVKLPRNGPCWCGSGRKYKGCHYKTDRAASALPKLGNVLSEIAEPLLEWAGSDMARIQLALRIAMVAWNAERGVDPSEELVGLDERHGETMVKALSLLRLRAGQWSDDPRVVASVEAVAQPGGYAVHVVSALPGER